VGVVTVTVSFVGNSKLTVIARTHVGMVQHRLPANDGKDKISGVTDTCGVVTLSQNISLKKTTYNAIDTGCWRLAFDPNFSPQDHEGGDPRFVPHFSVAHGRKELFGLLLDLLSYPQVVPSSMLALVLVDQGTGFDVPFVMLCLLGTLEEKVRRKSQRVWMVTINEHRDKKNG